MASKILEGKVVTIGMKNTVGIEIVRRLPHTKYKKLITRTKTLLADTNSMEIAVGDVVRVQEIKPMSKRKNFKVIEKK